MNKEKRLKLNKDKTVFEFAFLLACFCSTLFLIIFCITQKDYKIAILETPLAVLLIYAAIKFIPLLSITLVFEEDKITVIPFVGRKTYYHYDDFCSVATIEIINEKGTITSRWLALIKENQEYSIWMEPSLGGKNNRSTYLSIEYSKGMENFFYTYFKKRKRIRASRETGNVLSILDLSNNEEKETDISNKEEKIEYTSIVENARYDLIRERWVLIATIIGFLTFIVLYIVLDSPLTKGYRYVGVSSIAGGTYGVSTLYPSSSSVYKIEGKNLFYFSLVRYRNSACEDATFLNIHWTETIDLAEVERVEICELSKKEAKKLVKGPKKSRKYLRITLKNGRVNGISVANYSSKQIEKIMEEIGKCLAKR